MTRSTPAALVMMLALSLAACGGSGGGHTSKVPGYRVGTEPGASNALPGEAGVAGGKPSVRTTFLLSTANGSVPDGPSRNAAVSHDQRIASYITYESDATSIVPGDTNGYSDIFLVRRAHPYGMDGTPWRAAETQLISKGRGGSPANGRSYEPAVDGDAHHAPRCVGFISEASNLVPGDTNNKPDGFVYDIKQKTITRVTVDSGGRQANGSTYDISISGHCKRVAFTSDATNLALTKTSNRSWTTSITTRPDPGKQQVYLHFIGGTHENSVFTGLTFLVSAAAHGEPGNGDSNQVKIARSGKALVFTSTATNLVAGDRTSASDVYRRTLYRKFKRMADGHTAQTLQGDLGLVSATATGRAGNGPSSHPSVTDDTRYVAFETNASDILFSDHNGVTDIARADMKTDPPRADWVSGTSLGGIGNGPSHHPVISDAGDFILFDSDATNFRPSTYVRPDPNGVKDVFLWNAPTRNVSLESRDAKNGYLSQPSQHPATSSRGNYVAFESASPAGDQIYVRYLGPK